VEHLQEFVPLRKCKQINNKRITLDILSMVSKPKNSFHWSFLQVIRLIILIYFDLIEWKLCFVNMNVVSGLEDHHKDPNHMRSIKCDCLAHFSTKRLYT